MSFDLVLFLLLRSELSLSFSKNADLKATEKIMSKGHFIDHIVVDMYRQAEPIGAEYTTLLDVIVFFFLNWVYHPRLEHKCSIRSNPES